MPEGYTHVKMANRAAEIAEVTLLSPKAYALGANGPDPLFFYQSWLPAKNRRFDLHKVGGVMHREKTGAFLRSLLTHAKTAVQWDYVLGFLCHYGVDSVMHPYVAAVQEPGEVYDRVAGHGFFEIGLDSYLHQQDTGSGAIPAEASTPKMDAGEQLQIALLLQTCLEEVYGLRFPAEVLNASFDHMRLVRGLLCNPSSLRKKEIELLEKKMGQGFISCHVTPAPLEGMEGERRLPANPWRNPCSGTEVGGDLFDALEASAQRSALLVRAAVLWRMEELTWEQLCQVVGSVSYETGLTVE